MSPLMVMEAIPKIKLYSSGGGGAKMPVDMIYTPSLGFNIELGEGHMSSLANTGVAQQSKTCFWTEADAGCPLMPAGSSL